MMRFYENLLGHREGLDRSMSKTEALDEAKRWLRNLTAEEVAHEDIRLGRGLEPLDASPPIPCAGASLRGPVLLGSLHLDRSGPRGERMP